MDPKIILVYSEKGGVGKSTIAGIIMDSFERTGISFSFFDLDGQGASARMTTEIEDPEVIVIDTPGSLSKDVVEKYMAGILQKQVAIVMTTCSFLYRR